MKKLLFCIMLPLLLTGCGRTPECPPCVCAPCEQVLQEVEVTRVVEVENQAETVCELGPWTIQQSISQNGQYLVPDEMQPGQWAYQADDPSDECWAKTYSDLSGSDESILNYFYSENKGFFVLSPNVRMVELKFGPCTWTRIGD